MKNPILIVVSLFLASAALEIYGEAYKFGDLIAFPRDLSSHGGLSVYKHYAIYVGSKKFAQQTPEEDIFHFTGSFENVRKGEPYTICVFDKLSKHRQHKLDNYLDEIWEAEGLQVNPHDIMRRIKETYRNCGRWNALTNNCEHVATYIRYGLKISWQGGQFAQRFVRNQGMSKDVVDKIRRRAPHQTYDEFGRTPRDRTS